MGQPRSSLWFPLKYRWNRCCRLRNLIANRFAQICTYSNRSVFFENVYDFLLSDPFRSNYNTLYTCSGSLDIDRFSSEKYVFPRFQAAILALYHLQSDRSANPWDRTIGLSVNANIWIICISFARVVDRSGRFLFFSFFLESALFR